MLTVYWAYWREEIGWFWTDKKLTGHGAAAVTQDPVKAGII